MIDGDRLMARNMEHSTACLMIPTITRHSIHLNIQKSGLISESNIGNDIKYRAQI